MGITVTSNGKPTTFPKVLNDILWSVETAYRDIALQEVNAATKGLTEGTDYVVLVDGRATGKAGIRSAKLFNPRGIEVRRTGDPKALFAAWRVAMSNLENQTFTRTPMTASRLRERQRGGSFTNLLVTAIDGKMIASPTLQDFEGASVVEIWSRARHAGPLQAIYQGNVMVSAINAVNRMAGVSAILAYGQPVAYDQVKVGNRNPLAVPIVVMTPLELAGSGLNRRTIARGRGAYGFGSVGTNAAKRARRGVRVR